MATFKCSCCGAAIPGPPLRWTFDAPALWTSLSEEERGNRGHLSSDFCVIGEEHFFIRGLAEIPVKESEDAFAWNLGISASKQNFLRARDLWDDPLRAKEPAYFGWLCNSIPG